MFGSRTLEVGIGMALLFLFMSLIATALRELVENVMKSRSRDLERGIIELLRGHEDKNIVQLFYNHPLISSLYSGSYAARGRDLPSYIPRQNFSAAMLDIASGLAGAMPALSIKTLEGTLASVPAPNAVQRVALLAIQTADGDLVKVRAAIEDWYDGTMDRVSGWYTRRTGRILGIIGLLAAAFFDVDAITVAEYLDGAPELRAAIVAQAQGVLDQAAPAPGGAPAPGAAPAPEGTPKVAPALQRLVDLQSQFQRIGFPIGWVDRPDDWPVPRGLCRPAPPNAERATCVVDPWRWPRVVIGWAITALAIMLGAPFWFDILNRFMIVRSTIKPKEKSPDETSPEGEQANAPRGGGSGGGRAASAPETSPAQAAAVQAAALSAADLALRDGAYEPRRWAGRRNAEEGLL